MTPSRPFDDARCVLTEAIGHRTFPAAVAEVGSSHHVLWSHALGTVTFAEDAAPVDADTPFDLASLTKPIATTSVILQLAADGTLGLADPVASCLLAWRGIDRETVTLRDLLEHTSGLPGRLVDRPPSGREEFAHEICSLPLAYAPRAESVYSDLGFILLGLIASTLGARSLADQFASIRDGVSRADPDLRLGGLAFTMDPALRRRAAPTLPMPDDLRQRTLVGEVHDIYAAVLGDVSGHAGLFGTAGAVGAFARAALRGIHGEAALPSPLTPALLGLATTRSAVPGSSRGLGWDTMLPASSCGTRMSARAFGHVGFTGTSLWIDPLRDRYFVLLTNRACGGGPLEVMRDVRRRFHDSLGEV